MRIQYFTWVEIVYQLRANKFLPLAFKLPHAAEKMLFKLIPATIQRRGRIGAVLESKSVGKAGFNGSFGGKQKFLIVLLVSLFAAGCDFLLHHLGKLIFEAQQVIQRDAAHLDEIGNQFPAKLQKHGLGNVLLAALTVQPTGKRQIRPVQLEHTDFKLDMLIEVLIDDFLALQVHLPTLGGFTDRKFSR